MVLRPSGSVGTHPGCPEWRSDVPILFHPFCLWEERVEVGAYRAATVYRIVVLLGGCSPKLWLSQCPRRNLISSSMEAKGRFQIPQSGTFYSHVTRNAPLCHYWITMGQLGGETSLQFPCLTQPYCNRKINSVELMKYSIAGFAYSLKSAGRSLAEFY